MGNYIVIGPANEHFQSLYFCSGIPAERRGEIHHGAETQAPERLLGANYNKGFGVKCSGAKPISFFDKIPACLSILMKDSVSKFEKTATSNEREKELEVQCKKKDVPYVSPK